jgi:FixJ family two-component response regulator
MNPIVGVVDDDEALRLSLVDLIQSVGYHVVHFDSAENLLISPDRFCLGCIIADIHMPGLSGLRLLHKLHEEGIMTPVILITALPDRTLDQEAIVSGAQCLLRKPFQSSSLLDWVERSLSQ